MRNSCRLNGGFQTERTDCHNRDIQSKFTQQFRIVVDIQLNQGVRDISFQAVQIERAPGRTGGILSARTR